jgi:uncharacterized membrane-anchored protein
MIKFIAFLIFACLFGIGVFWLSLNSGNLSFTVLDYSVETKVAYAVVILLIALLLVNFVLAFLYRISALPSLIRDALIEKKRTKKELLLLELIEAISKHDTTQVGEVFKNLKNLNLPEKIRDQISAAIAHTDNNHQAYKSSLLALLKYADLKVFAYTQLIDSAVAEQDWLVGCNYCAELWKLKADEHAAKLYIKVFYNAKRYQECLDFLSQFKMMRLLKKKSRDALEGLCYFQLAQRELEEGTQDKIESYYEYAIDKLPEFIPALKGLIAQKIHDELFDDAVKIIERVWKKLPHHVFAQLLQKTSKHFTVAEFHKIVRKVVSSQPKHYESHLILAESSIGNAQFELAAKEIAEALSHSSKSRALLLMARFCLSAHGNAPEVLEWLKQANDAQSDIILTQYYVDFAELSIVNASPKDGLLVAAV